ncbi:MAG: T9SS type A sorting domain-containing protein [Bacteroidales bacterium]|nr:T9SS type A sorting domain-containing protein [Bacteroidales bacterium]MCF8404932.1 T9SS type A sorting domain-containing protein [Bacteroidales bacterium]
MTKLIILSILLFVGQALTSQSSYELEYGGSGEEKLFYTFETSSGSFISTGIIQEYQGSFPRSPLILEFYNSGEIINELIYAKPDTSFYLQYGYEKANGNYFLVGTLSDSLPTSNHIKNYITYVCEITPDLNLVWEKVYPIPEPYNRHQLANFILDADSNLYVHASADSSMVGSNRILLTMKFDKYGNQLDLNVYGEWHSDSPYNEMIFNSDSTAIYFLCDFSKYNSLYYDFIEMDIDLNITGSIDVIDWEHLCAGPASVKLLPNSTFIQANKAFMEPGVNQDLYVKIMDEDFNTIRDTLILYPENNYMPSYEGMGFIDPDQIWIATFQPAFNSSPGTEIFRFHIFDSNLNLTGMKVYGGDRRYWFNNLMVTSDGGCLMTGSIPDYNGSYNDNGYIIKVMPEDIITHAEETAFEFDRDVMVYPNPFGNEIRFQTVRKNLTFDLYDLTGKKILSGDIKDHTESRISTGNVSAGIYFYTIQDDSNIIQNGKMIKK